MPIENMFRKYKEMDKAAGAVAGLDGLERQAVVMRYLGDFSEHEVAQRLGVPPEQARQLALRGLQQAKEIFKQ